MVELPLAVGLVMAPGIGTGFVVGIGGGLGGIRLTPGVVVVLTVGRGMRLSTGAELNIGSGVDIVDINVPVDVTVRL